MLPEAISTHTQAVSYSFLVSFMLVCLCKICFMLVCLLAKLLAQKGVGMTSAQCPFHVHFYLTCGNKDMLIQLYETSQTV